MHDDTYIDFEGAAIYLALRQWGDHASEDDAIVMLKSLGYERGSYTPVMAMRTLAEREIQSNIDALAKANKVKLYNPITYAPTQDQTKALVLVSELVALIMKGEHLNLDAQIQQHIERRKARRPAPLFGKGFSEEARKLTTLSKYLDLETWSPLLASLLVCGIQPPIDCAEIPNGAMGLDNSFIPGTHDPFHEARRIWALWNSQMHAPEKVRPVDFVAWCKTKGIDTGWLDDIEQASPPHARSLSRPPTQQRFQENEILRVINGLGLTPTALPPRRTGQSGTKAQVRQSLRNFTTSVFDHAWERLRSRGEIKES